MNKHVCILTFILLTYVLYNNEANSQSNYRDKDFLELEEFEVIKSNRNLVPYLIQNIESATDIDRINNAFKIGALLDPELKSELVPISIQYLNHLLLKTGIVKHDKNTLSIRHIFKILVGSDNLENKEYVLQFIKPPDQWQIENKSIKYHQELTEDDSQIINTSIRLDALHSFTGTSNEETSVKNTEIILEHLNKLSDNDSFKKMALEYIDTIEKIRNGELPRGTP